MTSIPSNLGPAVTLGQDAIKPSRQTAEERQLFEEARIRGKNKAAREEAETQEIIDSTKDRTLVLSHAEFPHTSDPERLLTPTERYERTSESRAQAVTMMLNDLPQATERANDALSRLEQEIFNDRPHLQHQEWDFSINANDTLELVNSDDLSTNDSRYLTEKLNGSGLPRLYSDLRDTMTRILDAERGVENYSTSIGKYDLTEDN